MGTIEGTSDSIGVKKKYKKIYTFSDGKQIYEILRMGVGEMIFTRIFRWAVLCKKLRGINNFY